MDKILRKKAEPESFEEGEDVTEGVGDTVILSEGQQHPEEQAGENI